MVYIIVLNWKNAEDTIACFKSLLGLKDADFRIVICDNASPDDSYIEIKESLLAMPVANEYDLIELNRSEAESYLIPEKEQGVYLVQTGENLGYAGGNNVGIRLAMNQADMRYVWVLNNDTEVEPDSLYELLDRCEKDSGIGICGSRLVYDHDRTKLQGLGGVYNSWFCRTKHYAAFMDSQTTFDDDSVSKQIDYVIGASMILTKPLLEKVGLLCEDYFLYFEELDISLRAKGFFKIGVATKSIVYHKEGASTESGKSDLADFYSIKNRLLVTKKFKRKKILTVWLSLFVVCCVRGRNMEWSKAKQCMKIFFGQRTFQHKS